MWDDARDLAVGFMVAIEDACAQHRIETPGGHAILDSKHRLLWDANHIRVETVSAPNAEDLTRAADQHLGGERFRMITLLHEEAAAELRAPLTELDYRSADRMLMVLRGTPPPDTSGIEVHAIARGSLEVHREATLSEHPQWSSEVGRQMISRDMIVATVVPERCYAVLDNGGIVARCQVYGNGAIAQIEHVYTLAAHRGRGYARALVTFAAREARAMGASEVFLVAETEDWPRQFYGRLGFADAGLMPRFLRLLK